MEPLPETSEAIRRLTEFGDDGIEHELSRIGQRSQAAVPEIVGLSLALLADRLTFTLVASGDVASRLDAVQYLDDGPCVQAIHQREDVHTDMANLLDEKRWLMFARASACEGIASTLSLPVRGPDEVVAGVNFYASTPDAFVGHHEELADICRAWAPGAVTNADLGFSSRLEAAATPGRMRDRYLVDQATGMLAESQRVDTGTAAQRIVQAAARAGISEIQAAETVIRVLTG